MCVCVCVCVCACVYVCKNNESDLSNTYIIGGKTKEMPMIQYIDNIKKWARPALKENIRMADDRHHDLIRSCADDLLVYVTSPL